MTGTRPAWGPALILYAALRRAWGKAGKTNASPRTLAGKIVFILFMMPLVGPMLWHAVVVMPPAVIWFITAAVVVRILRWVWRKGYFRQ
jgi:hypothetical protein